MNIENWLYFRNVTDEDNDDGDTGSNFAQPSSICVPASAITEMQPLSDTAIKISFSNLIVRDKTPGYGSSTNNVGKDEVFISVTQGKTKEVMTALAELISGKGTKGDGFTVVADKMTTNAANETVPARYFHPDITNITAINVYKTKQGHGMHEYYEVVTPMQADDNDVAASLSIKLPAQCIILEAGMTAVNLATSNHGLVALEMHNAIIADDAASGGTEILGADVAGDKSIPDTDLDVSSDAVALNSIHSGTLDPIDRDTAVTHFHVTAKEDMSSMTGTARVGVYIRWFGQAAVALTQ